MRTAYGNSDARLDNRLCTVATRNMVAPRLAQQIQVICRTYESLQQLLFAYETIDIFRIPIYPH